MGLELLKNALSELDWQKAFDYEFDNDKPGAFKFDGAGEHVTAVFDVYTLDVLSRMIDVEKSDGSFTFEKLVEKFGGYPEYFKRETVLLAKRVYRYLKEKDPHKVESFSQEDKPTESDWFQILLEKATEQGVLSENVESAGSDEWKVRKDLRDVLEKKNDIQRLGRNDKSVQNVYVQAIIDFVLKNNVEWFTPKDLKYNKRFEDLVNEYLKVNYPDKSFEKNTFAPVLPSHTASSKTQKSGYSFGPNYFYIRDNKYGLTENLGHKETEHDVCKYLSDTQNTGDRDKLLGKKRIVDIASDIFRGDGKRTNTLPWFSKLEICGHEISSTNPDSEFTYIQLLMKFFEIISSTDPGKMKEISECCKGENVFRHEPKWKKERNNKTFKIPDIINEEVEPKRAYSLGADMWVKIVNTPYIHKDYCDLLNKFNLADQVYVWMNENEPVNIERYSKMKNTIKDLLLANGQIVLTGAPGTGKTYLAKQIAADMIGTNLENLENNDHFKFVQFHPSYDYTDFVEGLRPKKLDNNNIGFERKNGTFKEFCKNAKAKENEKNEDGTPKEKFVFVIDEINRGDISKIFGELFYAIDPGYRGGVNGKVNTQYQNLVDDQDPFESGFYVPENVYIIGTMNDIDRSVESMDFAIRRRFIWYAIEPTSTQESILSNATYKKEIKNLMEAVNLEIVHTDGLGEAFQLGASYFRVKPSENEAEPRWEDCKGMIWKYRVEPLLKEYLRGLPNEENALRELKNAWNNPDDTIKKYNDGDAKTN